MKSLLLFFLIPVLIMATTKLSNSDAKEALNDVLVKNAKQYFIETSASRSAGSLQTWGKMCKILPNNGNMKDLMPNVNSDKFIANKLNIIIIMNRRLVHTFQNNKTPLKDIKPVVKSKWI